MQRVPSVIIAHHKAHIDAALAAAQETQADIILQTPPHGLQVHGLALLVALFNDVPDWILDCGQEAALAVEAMRLGVKKIRADKTIPAFAKLEDIAQQLGVTIVAENYEVLDLAKSFSPADDCKAFFMKAA